MSDSESRKKTINRQVRMTPEEFEVLSAKAATYGVKLPQYLRDCGMERPLRSLAEQRVFSVLSQLNADQGRLGGLLKLWLTEEERSAQGWNRDIKELLEGIKLNQEQISAALGSLHGGKS